MQMEEALEISGRHTYENTVYLSIGEKEIYLNLALAHPYSTYQSKAARALGKVIQEVAGQPLEQEQ